MAAKMAKRSRAFCLSLTQRPERFARAEAKLRVEDVLRMRPDLDQLPEWKIWETYISWHLGNLSMGGLVHWAEQTGICEQVEGGFQGDSCEHSRINRKG
eukprot:Skav212715  [mRNA]  locus=scaffold113:453155:454622:- [translate_table: standard]